MSDRKSALSGLETLIRSDSKAWGEGTFSTLAGVGGIIGTHGHTDSQHASTGVSVYLDCLLKLGEWKIAMIVWASRWTG